MQEYLAAKRQFREKFAEGNPNHPHLGLIDADIAEHEAMIELLDGQVKPVVATPEAPPVLTSEAITAHWRDRWAQWGGRIRAGYDIPDLTATREQLAEIYSGGRKIVYVPGQMTTARGLIDLGRIFPDMRSWATFHGTIVSNDQSEGGYFAVEASVDAPNLDSDGNQLSTLFDSFGRNRMTLSTYIIASQDSKLETGHYFDERTTWSRLPGSRFGDSVVHAHFSPGGRLNVDSYLRPRHGHYILRRRSQEAISAY